MADKDTDETEKRRMDIKSTSIAEIEEERNLQRELTKILKEQGVLYEEHTGNIGESVKKLTLIDVLNAKIKKSSETSNSLAMRGVELAKKMVQTNLKIEDLAKKAEKLKNAPGGRDAKTGKFTAKGIDALKAEQAKLPKLSAAYKDIGEKIAIKANELNELRVAAAVEMAGKKELGAELAATIKMKQEEEKILALQRAKAFFATAMKAAIEQINKLSGITLSFYSKIFEIFKSFDNEMFSLRQNFGLFRAESAAIEKITTDIANKYMAMGVTIEMSSEAMKALGNEFGLLSSYTAEMVADIALFSASLGLTEKTSVSVLQTFASMSGKTLKDTNEGMIGFAASLSTAAGTNLNEVMSDIATASESVRSTFRGNTTELIKATVEARRMGMSLAGMATSSESLLDFNTSVNAEMEASVLLGKNINFIEARRAAFNGDLLAQSREILKVVKSAGDFEKMNMMQKKAVAKAAGMSVGEIQKMLQKEEEIAYIRSSKGTPEMKEQLRIQEDMLKASEDESKDIGKRINKRNEEESNQAKMVQLQQQFNKLILEVGKPILNMINPLADLAVKILPPITEFFKSHPGILTASLVVITAMGAGLAAVGAAFSAAVTVAATLTTISTAFGSAMAYAAGAAAFAAAKVALIGSAILAVKAGLIVIVAFFSYKLGNLIYETFSTPFDMVADYVYEKWVMLCDDLVGGIKSIGGDIFDAVIYGFKTSWEWIKSLGILGKSPSDLGLSIVDGISSVGTMLFDALISPFKTAYDFATNLFSKIPEFISSVFKRGFDFVMSLPGMGILTKVMNKLSGRTTSPTTSDVKDKTSVATSVANNTDQLVLAKLTELVDLMRAGGIVINLDGRKVSEALAHASR